MSADVTDLTIKLAIMGYLLFAQKLFSWKSAVDNFPKQIFYIVHGHYKVNIDIESNDIQVLFIIRNNTDMIIS